MLPRHQAAVAAVSVGLSHALAPTSTLQGLVVCDKMGCFFPLSDVWLAGWSHAGRVCLSDASCTRDQRKPCSRSRPSVCTHSNGPEHELTRQGYGSIYTKFTKIDRLKVEIVHILVIITAVTQIHGNRHKSRYKAKITVITVIVNSWFTYIPTYGAMQHLVCMYAARLTYYMLLRDDAKNNVIVYLYKLIFFQRY